MSIYCTLTRVYNNFTKLIIIFYIIKLGLLIFLFLSFIHYHYFFFLFFFELKERNGSLTPATDVYAFGIMMWAFATYKTPFVGKVNLFCL